jgi:hypothetical protein
MFQVIYIGHHNRYGKIVRLSDYRIHSLEELRALFNAGLKPLDLWCGNCMEKLQPMHAEVFAVEDLKFRYVLSECTLEEFFQRIPTLV